MENSDGGNRVGRLVGRFDEKGDQGANGESDEEDQGRQLSCGVIELPRHRKPAVRNVMHQKESGKKVDEFMHGRLRQLPERQPVRLLLIPD
jgi:hypothetical protein